MTLKMISSHEEKTSSGLGEVLRLSLPASLSMLNRTIAHFVDGVMVAQLGPSVISGSAIGGLVAFIPESFSIGALGVVNTYVSQNLGANRLERCSQYAWAGLMVAAMFSLFMCPLVLVARPLFAAIGYTLDVQPSAVLYFRYMILSVPIGMSIRVLEAFFYGVRRPGIIYSASLIANICNVAGNYVLIFGHLGFPAMGLQGAAIATVSSWGLQLLILAVAFLSPTMHRRFATRSIRAVQMRQCFEILHIGWPAGMSFFIDLLTWGFFTTRLIWRFGAEHLTASTAAMRYMMLSFLPAVGVGIAATTLVGRYIGQGRHDLARKRAHTALGIAMVYMGTCALCFLLFRHPMIRLFVNVSPQAAATGIDAERIVHIGGQILICGALFQIFDSMAVVFFGALRGAGDTRWPMVITAVSSLGILVGGGLLMVTWAPELKSLGPYLAATVHVCVLGLLMRWRFRSGAWRKIDLLGQGRAARPLPVHAVPDITPTVAAVDAPAPSDGSSSQNPPDPTKTP